MSIAHSKSMVSLNKLLALAAVILIGSGLFSLKVVRSTEMKLSLSAWEDVHEWKDKGKCGDCHSEQAHVEQPVDLALTLPIPAPRTHTTEFRRFTHGKNPQSSSFSCNACHEQESCITCHSITPETHTSDFIEPLGESLGSIRHAVLARSSPQTCLTCHQSFADNCTECHSSKEVRPWEEKAAVDLLRWTSILGVN